MASKDLKELLESLDNVTGVSGREQAVAQRLKEELEGCYDETLTDAYGNIHFKRKGTQGFTVLLIAHMDELGFVVNYIEENGMVRFLQVGYHDDRMAINQDLLIHTKKGAVRGVSGAKLSHILSDGEAGKTVKIADLFIDVGTKSREETLALGVKPGCVVSFDRAGGYLNGTTVYSGKSVDNRAGCAVMAEVLRRLAAEDFRGVSVSAVGSVQEEVGARGAHIVSAIIHPDVCIVLDVTLAGGVPDAEAHELPVRIGGGPAVTMFHWGDDAPYGTIVPEDLLDRIEEVAARENIPVQPDNLMGTWTDGFAIERSGTGVKTCGLSVPSRYVHTAVGIVDLEDMQKTADLAVALVKSFYTEVWND